MLSHALAIIFTVIVFAKILLGSLKIKTYGSKYVFITGCDTGFGNMLTKQLDDLQFYVFAGCLTSSGETGLRSKCSDRLVTVRLDVTRESCIKQALATVKSKLPHNKGLWALVNNAGTTVITSPSEWRSRESYQKVLAVNLFGMIDVTRTFLPLIRKTPGRIVNMSSIMGRYAGTSAPYSISKYGVEAFSDILRRELYKTGVTVHILEPGHFATGIMPNLDTKRKAIDDSFNNLQQEVKNYYGWEYKEQLIYRADSFLQNIQSKDVHKVIDAYTHALTSRFPKARYMIGWDANVMYRLLVYIPEWLSDAFAVRYLPLTAAK